METEKVMSMCVCVKEVEVNGERREGRLGGIHVGIMEKGIPIVFKVKCIII